MAENTYGWYAFNGSSGIRIWEDARGFHAAASVGGGDAQDGVYHRKTFPGGTPEEVADRSVHWMSRIMRRRPMLVDDHHEGDLDYPAFPTEVWTEDHEVKKFVFEFMDEHMGGYPKRDTTLDDVEGYLRGGNF